MQSYRNLSKRHTTKTQTSPPIRHDFQRNRAKITNIGPHYNELECMVTFNAHTVTDMEVFALCRAAISAVCGKISTCTLQSGNDGSYLY